jgi:hypothetical protein
MTPTKVLRGVLAVIVISLLAGCSSTGDGSSSRWVVIDQPSQATVTVRSTAGFKGTVTVALDVSSEPSQATGQTDITSPNQVVHLKANIAHTGKVWVAVMVKGNGAGMVTVDDPVIEPMP